jgi:hypothetical protein
MFHPFNNQVECSSKIFWCNGTREAGKFDTVLKSAECARMTFVLQVVLQHLALTHVTEETRKTIGKLVASSKDASQLGLDKYVDERLLTAKKVFLTKWWMLMECLHDKIGELFGQDYFSGKISIRFGSVLIQSSPTLLSNGTMMPMKVLMEFGDVLAYPAQKHAIAKIVHTLEDAFETYKSFPHVNLNEIPLCAYISTKECCSQYHKAAGKSTFEVVHCSSESEAGNTINDMFRSGIQDMIRS